MFGTLVDSDTEDDSDCEDDAGQFCEQVKDLFACSFNFFFCKILEDGPRTEVPDIVLSSKVPSSKVPHTEGPGSEMHGCDVSVTEVSGTEKIPAKVIFFVYS